MKKIDYQSYPVNQTYRLELPNGQQGYDYIDRIVFAVVAKSGDRNFTYKELVDRGYKWIFDCGFAIPTND
ncbi:hypothetical protein JOA01_06350 [Streptococcus parasuis]|uniref:hypothetical protein n=1 Tax=Streptococcus parasuis TaxID=1501662 RepID=UPI001C2C3F3A|nr:hypothetical protein [Streptococcus parasuis]MBV1943218.1 hypothetical protein [Streptococcus parasuis]QXF04946.1 hypothetical protein JOA01_06350 [Streptococcus parasuis]